MNTHEEGRERRDACGECPVANSRRAFQRDIGLAAAAAVGAMTAGAPALAWAAGVTEIEPAGARLMERSYALPRMDGASVDVSNEVILARWQNRVYAFSLKCPHKGAQLEWRASEQRVFCPKHKARFSADGAHVSGRGSRALDRYDLRRAGDAIVVDVGRLYREDRHRAEWEAALVVL